jgi:hypothetical protein
MKSFTRKSYASGSDRQAVNRRVAETVRNMNRKPMTPKTLTHDELEQAGNVLKIFWNAH